MAPVVDIEALDAEGRGTAPLEGRRVHVGGALPGERWEVRLDHASPHRPDVWATAVARVGPPAADRVAPACPGHGRCGGCALQHLSIDAQLRHKRDRVLDALTARGLTAEVAATRPSPRSLGYRNRAKYVIASGREGGLVHGSYAPRTHQLVPMQGCQVPEPPLGALAAAFTAELEATGLPAYDERTREGELRYLVVRGSAAGQMLAVIVTRTMTPRPALESVARSLVGRTPGLVGVVHDVNATTGGGLFGGTGSVLAGENRLVDAVGDVELVLSARAFFQVNRDQATALYRRVAELAAGAARVVDLYCGVGGIALTLAARGSRVVGVELHEAAVQDASASASRAGLGQVAFRAGDAATLLPAASAHLGGLDLLVVNPPRKGLAPAALGALLAAAPPRVLYVSCGPESLARDLAACTAAGYRVERVEPFDMMPGTPEVESLALLSR